MITEFGVPTGLGDAHRGPLGRDQGNHSETDAGAIDAALLRDVRAGGFAGGVVFEYLDEWFKRTWNTQDVELPAERRALWRDVLTNEEQFGLVAAEPDARPRVVLDGRAGEWRGNGARTLLRGPVEVRATHDAASLYLLVRRRGSTPLQIGFDVRPGGNRGVPGRPGVDPDADVALTLGAHSARLDWAAWTDYLSFLYGVAQDQVPVDRAALAGGGATVELRIPWALLTYADPSSHLITVARADGSIGTEHAGPIGIAVAPAGRPERRGRAHRFSGWNRVRWHERRKAGWSKVARAFAAAAR